MAKSMGFDVKETVYKSCFCYFLALDRLLDLQSLSFFLCLKGIILVHCPQSYCEDLRNNACIT